jgi:haloalkane dehalogenase
MRNPSRVRGIAFMEPIMVERTWDQFSATARKVFQDMRTPGIGERLVLDENVFIELNLPSSIIRKLTAAEMDRYRAPFRDRASRLPTLVWPREIPIAGEPPEMVALVNRFRGELMRSAIPKLMFTAEPGRILNSELIAWCKASLPNLEIVPIGAGLHYIQEDNPDAIGAALAHWVPSLTPS